MCSPATVPAPRTVIVSPEADELPATTGLPTSLPVQPEGSDVWAAAVDATPTSAHSNAVEQGSALPDVLVQLSCSL